MTSSETLFPSKRGRERGGVWDEDDPTNKRREPVVRDDAVPRPGHRVAPWTDTDSPRSPGEEANTTS